MYSVGAAQEVRDRGVVETTQPNMVSDSRVHNSRTLICGIQVLDKVLKYAIYGSSVTTGGPAQVGGSAPDVLSVLSRIRAVYEVSP